MKVTGLLPGECQRKSSFFMVHKAAICDNTALILLLESNELPLACFTLGTYFKTKAINIT